MSVSVGIIGGGISGLACASHLRSVDKNIKVVVFDTGKHAAGGRCSTKIFEGLEGRKYLFDHSVQCFTAKTPEFRSQVKMWVEDRSASLWQASKIGHLKFGKFTSLKGSPEVFVGSGGVCSIIRSMCQDLEIKYPIWISKIAQVGGKWQLFNYDTLAGQFSHIVIAHNGKCAERLTADAKIPKINFLLKARFGAELPEKLPVGGQMQLSSLWVALLVFPASLGLMYEGAFVEGSDVISWIANNSKKLNTLSLSRGHECWTVISTRSFGACYKVPQENIPPKTKNEVISRILVAFREATNISGLPEPVFTHAQLWGAGLPLNVLQSECVYDSAAKVGICGDWLLRPSVEGAYLSGIEMAKCLLQSIQGIQTDVGLNSKLHRFTASSIGNFDFDVPDEEQVNLISIKCNDQDSYSDDAKSTNSSENRTPAQTNVTDVQQRLGELQLKRQDAAISKNANAKKRLNKKIRDLEAKLSEISIAGKE